MSKLPSDQALIGLLIFLSLVAYGTTLFNSFVYDDEQQILQNPYVKSWHYLPQIFGSTVWSFIGAAGLTNYYRPLMTFAFLILWRIFGDIPFGFHLFNITLNAAVVVMVFSAGRRLFQDRRIAWLAAVLFAVHPIHAEVVNWIAALPELEVTFFVLLAFWLFTQLDSGAVKIYLGTVVYFALALLSKEPALMFAPLAMVFEFFVRADNHRAPFTKKIARCAPIYIVAAGYLLLRIALFGKLAPVLQHPKVTWPQAIYSAFALVAGYTKYLFWPAPLSAFHVFHPSMSLTELPVVAGVCVVVLAVALILCLYKRAPAAAFCIFWIGITIAPMLNARWMASNVFTERYLYLPSVAFCWLIAWTGINLWDRFPTDAAVPRRVMVCGFALMLVVSLVAVIRRNTIWRDDLTLYTRTLQTNPDAAIIRSNLGALYFDALQFDQAIAEWQVALAQKPDNIVTMNALGIGYTRLGRYAEADSMFKQALTAKPFWGDSHFNYALLLQKTGHMPEALQEFKLGVTLSPLNGAAHRWYGEALLETGQLGEAVWQLQKAVELEDTLESMHDLVNAYVRQGHYGEAEPILRRIIAKFPIDSSAHLLLGKALENSGKFDQARIEYQTTLASDPNNLEAIAALHRLETR
ncbi:MAG: tetratricopeptide repeat protein [Acidobacteriota bacterium]|nr:tetratricopeptide repeat protein [Acidobacteriota bacterium]